jgi:hypothetical protein
MIFSKDNENGGFHYSDDDIQVERVTRSGKRKVQVKDHKYRKGSDHARRETRIQLRLNHL